MKDRHSVGIVFAVLSLFVCTLTVAAEPAVLASGLRELVHSWEGHDPRLSAQIQLHVTSPTGEPLVRIHLRAGTDPDAALRRLAAVGFRLQTRSSLNPALVEGFLPLAAASAAADIDGVQVLHATQRPFTHAGLVQSQAVSLEKADVAQARGVDGSGIRVGVMSDSYDACTTCSTNAAQDIATGDLPAGGVTVLQEILPSTIATNGPATDEGRAMLQLVHDIAPGSQLGFASAFNGELSFAENILALRSQFHADVIVDDTSYPDEPMYSDGIIAQAVDLVRQAGAAYFSSAGNNGLEAYEAEYRPISLAKARQLVASGHGNVHLDQIPAAIRPQSVHDFGNQDGSVSITQRFSSAGSKISFEWDEPFFLGLVKTNFIVYVFDKDGNFIDPNGTANFPVFYTTDNNVLTDEPFQFISLSPSPTDIVGGVNITDYQLVIGNVNGGTARHIKYINGNSTGVSERQNAPSVWGHAAARGARAIAATYYAIPKFTEDFSSPGPVTIYFDTQGNRLREPEVRIVPQLTAADGVDTTFFGRDTDGNGFPNFFGTSAAAPNAAAVAALVLQAAGGPGHLSPARLYRRLERTATPIPLPDVRWFSAATAGPVSFDATGDFTRWDRDFGLSVSGDPKRAVSSVSFDTTAIGLHWNPNPNRFSVGEATGVSIADMTRVVSPDASTFTIDFAPKSFRSGDSFRFGMSVFAPIQGGTQEDPDRFRGMQVDVMLDDGTVFRSTVFAPQPKRINRYAGFGLIDADRATRFEDDDGAE
jgi:hypothetical protein